MQQYIDLLRANLNLILTGAPGTGKTYIAKQIAASIVSEGKHTKYENLDSEQKEQIKFVQFHPSYDYTDFVEGLRPIQDDNGNVGFVRAKSTIFFKNMIYNFFRLEQIVRQGIN